LTFKIDLSSTMVCFSIIVSGKVQGVWFRASAKDEAERRNLLGSAKNLQDGSVYIEVAGSSDEIKAFMEWCKEGPSNARVDNLEVTKIELKSFNEFKIINIQSFYRGERLSNVGFIGFGVACIIVGFLYYYLAGTQLSLGFFSCSSLLGSIQILLGLIRFTRTFNRYKNAIQSSTESQSYLDKEERNLLTTKISKYKTKRLIVTVAFISGMLLFSILALLDSDRYILGTLAAFTLQAGVMLVFDLFGQYRAQEYLHQISKIDADYKSPLV